MRWGVSLPAVAAPSGARGLRLFRVEVGRLVQRWVFGAGVVVLSGIAWSNMVLPASPEQPLAGTFSSFAFRDNFVFALVVFTGTVAGSLAADRRRNYPVLVLARGVSRGRYVCTKAAAMGTVAGLGVFSSCLLAFGAAAPFLAGGTGRTVSPAGPYPGLLASHPLVNDVVLAVLVSAGAAGLVLTGLAFGSAVANEHVTAAVPVVVLIGGIFVFRTPALLFLGPYTQLSLAHSYTYALPRWAWAFTAPVYWCVFAGVCVAAAVVIFTSKEEV